MLPAVGTQAIEIAKQPDCCMQEFAALVERDAKLATDVLSMANSAMYSPGRPILGLSQAVIRLGFQECRNLIYSSGMKSLMNKLTPDAQAVREALCRHGFVTALLSLRLNHLLRIGCRGEEFTVGLMHDFGRTLLAVAFPEKFRQVDTLSFDEDGYESVRDERRALGVDHCRLGAWFAQKNKLPGPIIEAIQLHHVPERAVLNPRLTALTALSDHIANHIQRDLPAAAYDVRENAGIAALSKCGLPDAGAKLKSCITSLIDEVASDAAELMDF